MNQIDLAIPLLQQKVGTSTCGPDCLTMIYQYYGIEIDTKQILKDLHIDEAQGTWTFQLARHALQNSLHVSGLISHPFIFDPQWKTLPREKLIEKLKLWIPQHIKHEWITSAIYLLFYLQDGGEVNLETMTVSKIEQALQAEQIVLTSLAVTWLWGQKKIPGKLEFDDIKGDVTSHYVLIAGMNETQFKIIDPYPTGLPNRNGVYWVDKDEVLAAILMWSREILTIKKGA